MLYSLAGALVLVAQLSWMLVQGARRQVWWPAEAVVVDASAAALGGFWGKRVARRWSRNGFDLGSDSARQISATEQRATSLEQRVERGSSKELVRTNETLITLLRLLERRFGEDLDRDGRVG